MSLKQQYKNARAIIKQIANGEWEFTGSYRYDFTSDFTCYTAKRNGVELWVANGGLSCGIRDKPWELGMFGHIVWHFGAKQEKKKFEKNMRRKPTDLTM